MDEARWESLLDAVTALSAGHDLDALVEATVRRACALTGARYGALGVIDDTPAQKRLSQFATWGMTEAERKRIGDLPTGRGLLGHLIDHPEPLRLNDLSEHPASIGWPAHHPPMRTFLGVPVRVGEAIFGNLYLTDKAGGFTESDERIVVALAAGAGVAIANSQLQDRLLQAREEHASLAVYADRDRIARDLHDVVIQRLFATGLSLDRALRHIDGERARERVTAAVEDIDATITEIRRTIFELGNRAGTGESLHRVLADAEATLGHVPTLSIDGEPDDLDPILGQHLLAVVREGLANIARHAEATQAAVYVTIDEETLRIVVEDDGVGIIGRARESGLRNLRERAQARGGQAQIAAGANGAGTRLVWTVPLAS